MKKILWILPMLVLLQGCYVNVDGDGRSGPKHTTLGQELMDLEAAAENGTITDQEYQNLKRDLINAYK